MLSEQDLYKIKEIIGNSQEIDAKSKNELLDKFNKSNLNGYGLNFVRSIEDVEKETYPYNKDKFIFLNEDTEKEIFKGEDLTNNILFEGDNLESLQVLKSTHKGKIDVIYIDPPYNTGNKDFVYNDSFVSNDDGFKHSKWLSFMEKRLKLAYNLLSKEGVIFISIDDNEQANLKILCDSIFGEINKLSMFIWEKNPNPTFLNKYSRSSHEYVLAYAKDIRYVEGLYEKHVYEKTEDSQPLQNKQNPESVLTIGEGESDIFFMEKGLIEKGIYGKIELLDNIEVAMGVNEKEFRIKGAFRFRQGYYNDAVSRGQRIVFKTKRMSPRLTNLPKTEGYFAPKSILNIKETTQIGVNEVESVLGDGIFSYPKPTGLIKHLISMVDKPNATVLDFFAGSGTTGHAVLELNKEDGGNRNFILCTNNENNICEEVTYQRLSKVINGYTTPKGGFVEGILANLNYFKVDYIDTNEVYDFNDVDAIPYIELKEGVRYNFIDNFEYCSSKNKYVFLVVIEDDMLKVQEFLQNNDEKEVVIYCNSQSIKNKYFNTEFYPLFKSIDKDTILNISKDK